MPSVRLRTLGELSLRSLGDPSSSEAAEELLGASKGTAILALLAATPGHGARRSYLADLLWPDLTPSGRRRSLRQALHYLKRRAGTELLHREGDRLSLRKQGIEVDLWELEGAADEERWAEVVRLYGGPFVPDVPGRVSDEFRCRIRSVRSRVTSRVRRARDVRRAREMTSASPAPERPAVRKVIAAAGGRRGMAGGEGGGGAALPGSGPPHRHDWVTLLTPATVVMVGLGLAALLA